MVTVIALILAAGAGHPPEAAQAATLETPASIVDWLRAPGLSADGFRESERSRRCRVYNCGIRPIDLHEMLRKAGERDGSDERGK